MSDETKLSEEEIGEAIEFVRRRVGAMSGTMPIKHGAKEAMTALYTLIAAAAPATDTSKSSRRPPPGRAEIRREALEEAAKIAEREGFSPNASVAYCAAAFHISMCIRALLPPPGGEG